MIELDLIIKYLINKLKVSNYQIIKLIYELIIKEKFHVELSILLLRF